MAYYEKFNNCPDCAEKRLPLRSVTLMNASIVQSVTVTGVLPANYSCPIGVRKLKKIGEAHWYNWRARQLKSCQHSS